MYLHLLSGLQPLTIFQRSLTTMQIQIQGLLQFAVPLFPTAEVSHTYIPSYNSYTVVKGSKMVVGVALKGRSHVNKCWSILQ